MLPTYLLLLVLQRKGVKTMKVVANLLTKYKKTSLALEKLSGENGTNLVKWFSWITPLSEQNNI